MRLALTLSGEPFVQEAQIGTYSVDFLLARRRLVIEADGAYWHRDPEKDRKRDAWLSKYGWKVVRLPEALIKKSVETIAKDLLRANPIIAS